MGAALFADEGNGAFSIGVGSVSSFADERIRHHRQVHPSLLTQGARLSLSWGRRE